MILLDVNMPGMDGLETARADPQPQQVGAYADHLHHRRLRRRSAHGPSGYSLGAVDYIGSPVVPEILRTKVKVFVDLYLLARQARAAGAGAHRARRGEGGARGGRARDAARSAFLAQASAALAGLARRRRDDAGSSAASSCRSSRDVSALTLDGSRRRADDRARLAVDPRRSRGLATNAARIDEPGWQRRSIASVRPIDRSSRSATGTPDAIAAATDRRAPRPDRRCRAGQSSRIRSSSCRWRRAAGRSACWRSAWIRRAAASTTDVLSIAADLAGRAADRARQRAAVSPDPGDRTSARTSSSRCSRTSCAIRSRRSATPCTCCKAPERRRRAGRLGARRHRAPAEAADAPGRRPARRVADHARQDRAQARVARRRRRRVDVAVETSRPLVDAQRHTLIVHRCRRSRLRVRGDFARLAQVLGNLLNNAAKYTDPGGKIGCRRARARTRRGVLACATPAWAFPQESLVGVFEPFTQLDRTLDRSQGGLGIGLTLVRRLVEMQGGSVDAHSAGPARAASSSSGCRRSSPVAHDVRDSRVERVERGFAALASRKLSVLVVDDNRDVAESTAILLRVAGHDVHVALRRQGARSQRRAACARTRCCSTSGCPAWTATRWSGGCVAGSGGLRRMDLRALRIRFAGRSRAVGEGGLRPSLRQAARRHAARRDAGDPSGARVGEQRRCGRLRAKRSGGLSRNDAASVAKPSSAAAGRTSCAAWARRGTWPASACSLPPTLHPM